jgi:hypothetical protein
VSEQEQGSAVYHEASIALMHRKEDPMSHYRIVIQRVDDDTQPERVTELDRIEVPHLDARSLQKETALDHLETQTLAQGQEVMRRLLVRHCEGVEQQLVAGYRELFPPQPGEGGRP